MTSKTAGGSTRKISARWKKRGRAVIVRAGAVGRRLPGPVRRAGRRAVDSLPDRALTRAVRNALLGRKTVASVSAPPGARPPGASRLIPLNAAGSTYSAAQISTFLQMESAYLRNLHFANNAPGQDDADHGGSSGSLEGGDEPAAVDEQVREYLEMHAAGHRLGDQERVRHLILIEAYPRVGKEYGNGFVHRRVKYYQAAGTEVHVAVVGPNLQPEIYTYDGVHVLVGDGAQARELLRRTPYRSVSTHFLLPYLWDQVKSALQGHELYCFIHGYDSRRWIRTLHNYRDQSAIQDAIAGTIRRQGMWREVLAHPWGPRTFIFVSQWWRRAAQEDMEVVFPGARSAIIHNVIEDGLFRYVPKDAEQRFNILWIRPANNLNYGSDLAVQVLERLKQTSWWPRLSITIVGDGKHFGAFQTAFGEDGNVTIRREFIAQEEIAALHRDHGLFLVPTRLDSQGVSRDEAMASGLVPITNRVAAVGEFVDRSCAVLAGPEDVDGMVSGILRLFEHPEQFTAMSEAASRRSIRQSGPAVTVHREMRLLGLTSHPARPATAQSEGDSK